jgi:hypothetical protein
MASNFLSRLKFARRRTPKRERMRFAKAWIKFIKIADRQKTPKKETPRKSGEKEKPPNAKRESDKRTRYRIR